MRQTEATVFITGGSGGIGAAIKNEFEAHGHTVLAPTHEELDLGDPHSIETWFMQNDSRVKNIKTLIHVAGINPPKPFSDQQGLAQMDSVYQVNTRGFIDITQRLLPSLEQNSPSSVIAISSLYSDYTRHGRSPYTTSKHALNGFIKTLAVEEGPKGILVNAVSPGYIDSRMTRKNLSPEIIAGIEKKTALGRLGTPKDIAQVVYFLSSKDNSYITGQNIIVDGGHMAGAFNNT